MDNENMMTIIDDSGAERNVEIILTFDDDNRQKKYVLFSDPQDEEGNVYAYAYDEDGELNEINDEEWEMCAEVLGAFQKEDSDED